MRRSSDEISVSGIGIAVKAEVGLTTNWFRTGYRHEAGWGARGLARARFRSSRCRLRCHRGYHHDGTAYAAGAGAAELRAPDRAALRNLPHRLSRAYPVWPPVQAARLYDGWRQIPDNAVSVLKPCA